MQALAGDGDTVGGGKGMLRLSGGGPMCAPTRNTDPMMRRAIPKIDRVMNTGAADVLL